MLGVACLESFRPSLAYSKFYRPLQQIIKVKGIPVFCQTPKTFLVISFHMLQKQHYIMHFRDVSFIQPNIINDWQ